MELVGPQIQLFFGSLVPFFWGFDLEGPNSLESGGQSSFESEGAGSVVTVFFT